MFCLSCSTLIRKYKSGRRVKRFQILRNRSKRMDSTDTLQRNASISPYFYAVYWLRPASSAFQFIGQKTQLTSWDNGNTMRKLKHLWVAWLLIPYTVDKLCFVRYNKKGASLDKKNIQILNMHVENPTRVRNKYISDLQNAVYFLNKSKTPTCFVYLLFGAYTFID